MTITDAQAHVWAPETPERPWLPGGRDFAHGDSYTVESLLSEMDAAQVDAAVLVPPSFEGDRNDVCLAAARDYPDRFRVMGRITLTDPKSRGLLANWRDQPGMLGIRLAFSRGPSDNWMSDGTADWAWPEAEAAGVPIMVFAPDKLHLLDEVAERHPGLRLVVDHLGMRTNVIDDAMDPVIADLVKLARHDNVAVKATCLPSNVTEDFPYPSLHDRIHRVVDAFGPRRVFWGSDLTRLRGTYDEVRRLFTEELDFLAEEDLEWIMGRGVREWLGWK
ncbi:amidohydrolase family protein [Actinophytocola oryzae]|uniref:Putative TIM-barrel fold metal-dependent hydrolase n=1 Tax=Actinophytocola oryzae TaxID=502181 RepID=A0A4R7W3Z9_9PSEU|nr:amidohydrolase family protein [Actinophytocola oryzae]TDV56337.1 putative TIM-barrel fold metal-dependent hydrolase [Actinophytocola oryzae]